MIGDFKTGPQAPNQGVYEGDAWELLPQIPDHSIDFIFTDPVYNDFSAYQNLAQHAQRILKPKSSMVVFFGIPYALETLTALRDGGMPMKWQFSIYQPGRTARGQYNMFNHWYSAYWCGGPKSNAKSTFVDAIMSTPEALSDTEKSWGWRKSPAAMAKFLRGFTRPGDVVLDPFCGQGPILEACYKMGRRYIGFEINSERAQKARANILRLTPPLIAEDNDEWVIVPFVFEETDGGQNA